MNLERGFSARDEKREVWAPVTPRKPVVRRPDHVDVGMQHNQIVGENWQDLLGFCADVLQDESCVLPPSQGNHGDVSQGEPIIQNFAPVASLTTVDQNTRPTGVVGLQNVTAGLFDLNHRSDDLQYVAPIDKFRSFDQPGRNAGSSYLQNVGDVATPQKVSSLAELLGMSTFNAPTTSGDRISSVSENHSSVSQHSQIERNWNNCIPDSITPLQNHSFHANQDIGDYNLQQMPNSRLSVPYRPSYNLRLPPRSEAEESSSVARPFHLRPVTPDQQKLLKNNQISQMPNSIDEISSKEDNNRQDFVLPQQADIEGKEHNEFVSDTQSTASPNNSTTKEKQNLVGRNDGEFDLNKTPAQKTPKRKKHRPKVVVEGKPRRTPKSAAKENKNPTATKRKYVRKKGTETPKNQFVDAESGVTNSEPQGKTCKRALNFELETGGKKMKCKEVDNQASKNQGSNAPTNLDMDFHIAGLNRKSTYTEAVHQNLRREQKQTESTFNFIPSVEKNSSQESLPPTAIVPPTTLKDHTLNIIARSLNVRNTNINQNGVQGTYGGGGLSQLVLLANASQQDLARLEHPRLQSTQLLGDLEDIREKQERKRLYSHVEMTQPLMVSQVCSRGVSATGHFKKESIRPWLNVAVSSSSNINRISTGNRYAADFPEQMGSPGNKSFHAQAYKLLINGGLPYFGGEERSTLMNPAYETHKLPHHWYTDSNSYGLKFQKQMADTKSHPLAETQTNSSLTAVANCHMLSATHREPKVIIRNEITDPPAHLTTKRQYTRRKPPSKMSSTDKVLQQETRNLQGYGHDWKTVSGSQRHKRNKCPMDDITYRMKNLQISNNSNGNVEEEHNALVPYTGYGAVIPYEDPIKKRQPRPKVDLDPETNRLWNLLMGSNEGDDNAETMDKNKQKWWEEERRVFRGRVDSFIARMHLVQGDRRFSKWKGSVVDSVIGVFLTQNVSDHLSSSAFMSLAAKFPNKSTTTRDTSCQKAPPSAEYVVEVRHPDGTTSHQRMTREPVYENTVKSSKLSEYGVGNVTSCTFSLNKHTITMEEGTVSSQSSSESMSFLASEDIRSSSGSNSEVEDQVTGSNYRENQGPFYLFKEAGGVTEFQNNQIQETGFSLPDNRPLSDNQQYENQVNMQYPGVASCTNECAYPLTTSVQNYQKPAPTPKGSWQDMLIGMENMENDVSALLEKECTSSLTSTLCDTTSTTVTEVLHDKSGESMDHRPMGQQTGSSTFQTSTVYHKVPTKHLKTKVKFPTESDSRKKQHYEERGMHEIFQQESNFVIDSVKSAEALRKNPTDNEKDTTKTVCDSGVQSSKISKTSTAREQKAEKEKVQSFDWDTLRKQVQKGDTRERSRDTLDSLDYESIRNADVYEIAYSIKERGMNNMLAARMKDFLNRLVKDHGSVDLEWLRDAPPDKVKDYLLSIRGLGLKSVECVRLLTLHHLAFPVDTNVGRIAVRLGWVPLQPLPESLQLHLLEMYPVLESIQKYLWPRLCMLDQETLYELHYQLITFGKVFCTKRQPNCNGCPMRGECRHFASAFASARLTLPGPEERRVACSEIPASYSKSYDVVTRPMPLPPPEDNVGSSPGPTRNYEPIIEEPTTPESSTEVTERDIEDAFYEDPDEIPEIKLNIEEFTTNLKSFMQDNKDTQDGDMSKAIIALSPQLASIPTPKLKNVSRLRTEHQVYELPDSHPLLERMDRREPDDPSPYLLALWTPGETADSIQPPDAKCSSSEGGLCEKKTCFQCNSTKEAQAQSVRGTILIPCRTATRGSFPLNGTYFQVNEVFADHESSTNPIHVPRRLIWKLPRRTVFFGTSVSSIFKGMSTEGIQYCFWKGFVCVRGFDQKTRAPRPLKARLHLPASKIPKQKE